MRPSSSSGSRPFGDQGQRRLIRIAYLAHGVGGSDTGVHAKILTQAATWAALDPKVKPGIFVRCEAGAERDWISQPHVLAVRSSRRGIVGRLIARELLSLMVARWRPDVIYLRQSTVSPSVVALMSRIPTIVELNTLDLIELRLRSPLRYLYARAARDVMLRRAAGLVVVTDEIARDTTVTRLGLPVAVVPNGIDLASLPALGPTGNSSPRLVFLGTPGLPWHGVDKIERMASHFPSWTFDLVGPEPSDLARRLPNIVVHGSLDRAALLPIVASADVAIGPLALHRNRMNEASPLKVADYLAYGLPVIVAYKDTRFPEGAPFLLELPNLEHNIDRSVGLIEAFVTSWMGRRVNRADIGGIDALSVERGRLEFMLGSCRPLVRGPRQDGDPPKAPAAEGDHLQDT